MPVFNFNEVDEVTETTEDPRRPIPHIELPRRDTTMLGSVLAHGLLLSVLLSIEPRDKVVTPPDEPPVRRAFFVPPNLAAPPPPKVAAPQPTPPPARPAPTAPPPPKSARISIGEVSDRRAEEIRLERERDIGRRGTKTPQEVQRPEEAQPRSERQNPKGQGEDSQRSGLATPNQGALQVPRADDPRAAGPAGGLLSASTRSVERAMRERHDLSQREVAGFQMGPLFFDPEGADFTKWINHFKSEVYRNWIIPEPARFGVRGQVALEFTVERSGRITRIAMLSSSGTPALDRAASNALQGSELLALPDDYGAPSVTMKVTFVY